MITKDELMNDKSKVFMKIFLNGPFGSGKTYCAMTFPKWAYTMIEPNGIMTARTNPHLIKNMVCYESFAPSQAEEIRQTFVRLNKFIIAIREKIAKGEVSAFILDNISHLAKARWIFINEYEKVYGRGNKLDTRAMYGILGDWLWRFILLQVVTLPCHVIVTAHDMDEEEEDKETGKVQKTGKIISDVLGGFRNRASGLFNATLFLEVKKEGPNKHKYSAICKPTVRKLAKNNIGLPEVVEDVSYTTMVASINHGAKS